MSTARQSILLVAHGTRDARGIAETEAIAALATRHLAEATVALSFLELAEPSLDVAIDRLVAQGAREIVLAPLLLFAAGHALRDLPAAARRAVGRHAGLAVRIGDPLGCHRAILELSRLRRVEALANAPSDEAAESDRLLILVGRGSREPSANAQMARFARLAYEQGGSDWYEVGFTAMARPTLDEVLAMAARLPYRNVMVQPHLLFSGELSERIATVVRHAQVANPERVWTYVGHLGVSPLLVEALEDRVREAKALKEFEGSDEIVDTGRND